EDLQTVLESTPDHVRGNYNLGVVYMQGRHDYDLAETYFAKVIELSGEEENYATIKTSAQSFLNQIELERNNLSDPSADGVVL
ncbi:MAG: hypothetical protein HGA54_05870, partial [Actinobacteria bacterium]|nr:hypothetical protein [Actinomycetota bacterium]